MSSGSIAGTQTITIPNAATFNWSGGSITGGAGAPITGKGRRADAPGGGAARVYQSGTEVKPVTVEVSVFLPDAKVAPKVTIPLAANEYRQFRVLQQLGVGTAYNARIAIKVIDGEGRITAYGSVIDMQTQDPTYVPAQ